MCNVMLVLGDPAHSRGVETRWSLWSFSTQAILQFYDMIMLKYSILFSLCQIVTGYKNGRAFSPNLTIARGESILIISAKWYFAFVR